MDGCGCANFAYVPTLASCKTQSSNCHSQTLAAFEVFVDFPVGKDGWPIGKCVIVLACSCSCIAGSAHTCTLARFEINNVDYQIDYQNTFFDILCLVGW